MRKGSNQIVIFKLLEFDFARCFNYKYIIQFLSSFSPYCLLLVFHFSISSETSIRWEILAYFPLVKIRENSIYNSYQKINKYVKLCASFINFKKSKEYH